MKISLHPSLFLFCLNPNKQNNSHSVLKSNHLLSFLSFVKTNDYTNFNSIGKSEDILNRIVAIEVASERFNTHL